MDVACSLYSSSLCAVQGLDVVINVKSAARLVVMMTFVKITVAVYCVNHVLMMMTDIILWLLR